MEKRLLIAIVLSFFVIYGYQALFPPPPPPAAVPTGVANPTGPSTPAAQPAPGQTTAPAASAPALEAASPLVSAAAEQLVTVENDMVTATFSTRGGTLKSWRLKQYRDSSGEPLELLPQQFPNAPRPFSLDTDDAALTATLDAALFKPSVPSLRISGQPASLDFEYRDSSGLSARKQFGFDPARPYVVAFTADVLRNGTAVNPTVRFGPALGSGTVTGGMVYGPSPQPIFYRDGDVSRIGIGSIESHRQESGNFGFAGVDDHYFLSAALPSVQPVTLKYDPLVVPAQGPDAQKQFISWSARFPASPQAVPYFLGPKDLDVLQGVTRDLVRAIDFGMFDWLVVPLLRALKWVNGYVHNYGWAIIGLTVLINLAMFPLRHKSVVSMRRMQEIQPEVKAIQERYSKLKITDPARQKMNAELMNLYRERGANPATGCVPMLLTMPVLFAFYAMLSVAIELRGAPFLGWIRDLSAYDPLFITPVLMGITMFVQQKLAPMTVTDPVQQKMMMFMPLFFSAMLVFAPSGLVLYWTVSNLWTIGQQTLTNRLIGPPPQHKVRPAAERQLKNAGAGKSSQAAGKSQAPGKSQEKERK